MSRPATICAARRQPVTMRSCGTAPHNFTLLLLSRTVQRALTGATNSTQYFLARQSFDRSRSSIRMKCFKSVRAALNVYVLFCGS